MLNHKLKKFIDGRFPDDDNNSRFLVVGPPGTGKTYQLVNLVVYLLNARKISQEKIIVFCFNRKWAKILRERISEIAAGSYLEIPVTTFFAFCTELLEKSNSGENKQIEIITAPQQWRLLKDVIEDVASRKNYPITAKLTKLGPHVVKSYMQEAFDFILRAQENLTTPRDFLGKLASGMHPQLYELGGIYLNYLKSLKEKHLYNYGMLLTDAISLLQSGVDGPCMGTRPYDVVIVDELQELNKAQLEIVQKVSGGAKCVYFGNDDECTYAFRGSLINNFTKIHSSLSAYKDKRILYLQKNYRNRPQINDLCSTFISMNEYRIDKESLAVTKRTKNRKKDADNLPVLKEAGDLLEESKFICEYINRLIILKKVKPEKICIIIKGLGYKTYILENALSESNILFIRRGTRNVLDNKFVKYMLDFARLIWKLRNFYEKNVTDTKEKNSPGSSGDSFDLCNMLAERLLTSEITGVSPLFIKRTAATGSNVPQIIHIKKEVAGRGFNVFFNYPAGFKSGHEDDILKAFKFISSLNAFLRMNDISAYDFFTRLLYDSRTGIIRYLTDDKTVPVFKKEGILATVGDFMQSVKTFCKNNPGKNSINDYLVFMEDIAESGFIEEIEESIKNSIVRGHINIMSYHQCKGMEFDAVLMPFINKEYLPSAFKNNQSYDMQIFNFISDGSTLPESILRKKHYEDERKLFYTGISRAKKFLLITSNSNEERSAFFEEMNDIYNSLCSESLAGTDNLQQGKTESYKKHRETISKKQGNEKIFLKEQLPGMKNIFLARKRAAVMAYKLSSGKNISPDRFFKTLVFLKYFYHPDKWWSLRGATTNSINPSKICSKGFSYTSLSIYLQCPSKYKYRFYFSLKEDRNLTAEIGTLYHEIIKRFYLDNPGDLSWPKLENIIKSAFDSREFGFLYLHSEILNKTLNDFRNYFERYARPENSEIIVEKSFRFDMQGKIIKGRIDKISFPDIDKLELIDFKSGSKTTAGPDSDDEIQMPLYWLALKKSDDFYSLEGKKPVLKYIFLGGSKPEEMVFDHELFDFAGFEDKIINTIEKIECEKFSEGPKNRFMCRKCPYNVICSIRNEKKY